MSTGVNEFREMAAREPSEVGRMRWPAEKHVRNGNGYKKHPCDKPSERVINPAAEASWVYNRLRKRLVVTTQSPSVGCTLDSKILRGASEINPVK